MKGSVLCSLRILVLLLFLPWGISSRAETAVEAVSCLGRLVPGDEILLLEIPYFTQEPALLRELLVREGDRVTKNQVLATTHHRPVALAMVKEAEAALEVSKKTMDLVKAGAEPTVIAAQMALFKSTQADADLDEALYRRRAELEKDKAISDEEMDSARYKAEASRHRAEQAEKHLLSLSVVQKEKSDLAEAEVAAAQAALARALAMYELTEIRAPLDGMVLRIFARPGEKTERSGLMELGDVAHMRVEAEVHVSDIRRVAPGQKAEIRSEAFEGSLSARVESIDPLVRPNRFVDVNPKAVRENRVVTVRLSLDTPAAVEKLSGAEVSVVIRP